MMSPLPKCRTTKLEQIPQSWICPLTQIIIDPYQGKANLIRDNGNMLKVKLELPFGLKGESTQNLSGFYFRRLGF